MSRRERRKFLNPKYGLAGIQYYVEDGGVGSTGVEAEFTISDCYKAVTLEFWVDANRPNDLANMRKKLSSLKEMVAKFEEDYMKAVSKAHDAALKKRSE